MPFILRTKSLDDAPDERPFPTMEAAIEAAAAWFVDGYADDQPENLEEDVARLRKDLAAGREFYCSRFYETVSVQPS